MPADTNRKTENRAAMARRNYKTAPTKGRRTATATGSTSADSGFSGRRILRPSQGNDVGTGLLPRRPEFSVAAMRRSGGETAGAAHDFSPRRQFGAKIRRDGNPGGTVVKTVSLILAQPVRPTIPR